MKKLIITVAISCLAALIGGVVGYRAGRNDVLTTDFETYNADLIGYYGFPEPPKVELTDFLKARYYYFANRVPTSVLGEPYDFGSVDFRGLTIGKGPTSPLNEYQIFKAKKVTFKKPYVADGNKKP
jgi:hypothetical protein